MENGLPQALRWRSLVDPRRGAHEMGHQQATHFTYSVTKAHGVSIEAPFCLYGPVTSFWTVAPAFAAPPVWLMTCAIVPLPPPSDTVTMFRNRTPGATGPSKA